MLKALLREKMRWPHDKIAFPVGNKALFGIKLGFNSALAMYLGTNEYRISCVSWSYWIWKERTARQQISDTCLVPSRSRSLIWGIYELIIKEHGAKRVTVRGPSLLARTRRLFPSSLTRASHSSPVPRFKSPCSQQSLWNWVKPEEEEVATPKPQTTSQATLHDQTYLHDKKKKKKNTSLCYIPVHWAVLLKLSGSWWPLSLPWAPSFQVSRLWLVVEWVCYAVDRLSGYEPHNRTLHRQTNIRVTQYSYN